MSFLISCIKNNYKEIGAGLTAAKDMILESPIITTIGAGLAATENMILESPIITTVALGTIVVLGYLGHKSYQYLSNTCLSRNKDPLFETLNKLMKLESFKQLYKNVESEGSFVIRWAYEKEKVPMAMMIPWSREIVFSRNCKGAFLINSIVFELNNLLHTKSSKHIMNVYSFESADTFALAQEKLEYLTWMRTNKILNEAIQVHLVQKNEYPEISEEQYLKRQDEVCHTDLYRATWYKKRQPERLISWKAENMQKWLAFAASYSK